MQRLPDKYLIRPLFHNPRRRPVNFLYSITATISSSSRYTPVFMTSHFKRVASIQEV